MEVAQWLVPDKVWGITAEFAGITKSFFDKYFENKEKAVAYRLGQVKKYHEPLKLTDLGISFAPQKVDGFSQIKRASDDELLRDMVAEGDLPGYLWKQTRTF